LEGEKRSASPHVDGLHNSVDVSQCPCVRFMPEASVVMHGRLALLDNAHGLFKGHHSGLSNVPWALGGLFSHV
jgi:hypothetical protein